MSGWWLKQHIYVCLLPLQHCCVDVCSSLICLCNTLEMARSGLAKITDLSCEPSPIDTSHELVGWNLHCCFLVLDLVKPICLSAPIVLCLSDIAAVAHFNAIKRVAFVPIHTSHIVPFIASTPSFSVQRVPPVLLIAIAKPEPLFAHAGLCAHSFIQAMNACALTSHHACHQPAIRALGPSLFPESPFLIGGLPLIAGLSLVALRT